jgi:uncharacterized alkaline shock family protein YloU
MQQLSHLHCTKCSAVQVLRAIFAKQSPIKRENSSKKRLLRRLWAPRNDTTNIRKIMGEETTSLGRIHISPNAIATIAYHATLESYGVVGLAPMNIADGLVKTITREPSRGVSVRYNGEDIDIELHIIVEYGTRINSVAESVANTVRFHVEKALGLRVNTINVHVAGLRVSNTD